MLLFLKNLLFTLLIPGSVGFVVPVFLIPHPEARFSVGAIIALLLLLVGTSIYLWTLIDFARHGRGTPAPIDPPKVLVVRGLYRYSRNPMYLGILTVIFGWSLLFLSTTILFYGLSVAIGFHSFIILYEEPKLMRTFGTAYVEYFQSVGRWLTLRMRPIS